MAQLRPLFIGVCQSMPGNPYDPDFVQIASNPNRGTLGRRWRKAVKVNPLLYTLVDTQIAQLEYDLHDVVKAAFDLGREFEAAEAKKRKK